MNAKGRWLAWATNVAAEGNECGTACTKAKTPSPRRKHSAERTPRTAYGNLAKTGATFLVPGASRCRDEAFALADKIGLKVRDMRAEIDGDLNVGQHEAWQPIPY